MNRNRFRKKVKKKYENLYVCLKISLIVDIYDVDEVFEK